MEGKYRFNRLVGPSKISHSRAAMGMVAVAINGKRMRVKAGPLAAGWKWRRTRPPAILSLRCTPELIATNYTTEVQRRK
jgi:hypothetical protein